MTNSMTAYASQSGQGLGFSWVWEVRSVNGKGLDLRIRVPDWVEGLEAATRAALTKRMARGSVNVGLRLARDEETTALALDHDHLARVMQALSQIEQASQDHHVALAPPTAADILALRGVQDAGAAQVDTEKLLPLLLGDLEMTFSSFLSMRTAEGTALADVLAGQLREISALIEAAQAALAERSEEQRAAFQTNLARVMENTDAFEPQRVAQELAILAVKSDVTEELDRLRAHVEAAQSLLAAKGPVGRKLDFLSQEFNREANTLCSKAGSTALTRIGLDLKAVIDQMREQIQNIE